MTRLRLCYFASLVGFSFLAHLASGAENSVSFEHDIFPVLEARCFDCHSSKKQKGELRLDSPAWIRKGSENGDVLIPGDPESSLMYYLTTYPEDDPDYMPSKGEGLTADEKELFKRWIAQGANFGDEEMDTAMMSGNSSTQGRASPKYSEEVPLPPASYEVSAKAAKVIERLQTLGVTVDTVNHDAEYLEVTYTYADSAAAYDLALLSEVAESVVKLSYARSSVRDSDLAGLNRFANLRSIDLRKTKTGDSELLRLRGLNTLESLNLYGTEVSDQGLSALHELKGLKQIYLFGTKVTDSGIRSLKVAIPGLKVLH